MVSARPVPTDDSARARGDGADAMAALDQRFVLSTIALSLPSGPCTLVRPRSADELISEADFARDERLPYWADLWPSAIALARAFPELSPLPSRTLELGCGLGLVTIAALRAGHDVLATDYYADALLFTRRNARACAGREPRTQLADWRRWPAGGPRFDLVLASDVLYEQPYARVVADVIAATLARAGTALVADPGRVAAGAFREACAAQGLAVTEHRRLDYEDGAIHQVISVYQIRWLPA